MKEIFLYLWQLPQNLLGLILLAIYRPEKMLKQYNGVYVYFSSKFPSGISLGKYSILNDIYYRGSSKLNTYIAKHESIGHAKQSMILGPLYLIVIGLPSIIWAWLYGPIIKPSMNGYYKFYTEKWADNLANIDR